MTKILPFSLKTSDKRKSDKWLNKAIYRLVPVAGVEPARVISPTDFESVTSANSITPAFYRLPYNYTRFYPKCKVFIPKNAPELLYPQKFRRR